MAFRKLDELKKGIRVQYRDKYGRLRTGIVMSRRGNVLSIKTPLHQYTKNKGKRKYKQVHINDLYGYWPPRCKASPKNRILVG